MMYLNLKTGLKDKITAEKLRLHTYILESYVKLNSWVHTQMSSMKQTDTCQSEEKQEQQVVTVVPNA